MVGGLRTGINAAYRTCLSALAEASVVATTHGGVGAVRNRRVALLYHATEDEER